MIEYQPLSDMLKREISLMREVLSHYALEESLVLNGNSTQAGELKAKRKRLISKIRALRKKKQIIHPVSDDEIHTQLLHDQIAALDSEITDMDVAIKNLTVHRPAQLESSLENRSVATDQEIE